MTYKAFIDRYKVKFSAAWIAQRPDGGLGQDSEWNRSANHYKCKIRSGRHSFTLYFSCGSSITKEPTAEDVLDCLASDAAGYENANGFEDWASEYGYDTDSRKAEKMYNTIGRQANDLERVFGSNGYDDLLWHCERL